METSEDKKENENGHELEELQVQFFEKLGISRNLWKDREFLRKIIECSDPFIGELQDAIRAYIERNKIRGRL